MTRTSAPATAPPLAAVEAVVAADAALRTAEQLGLLAAIARGPASADELADGRDADAVAIVLDTLVALGLAAHDVEGYRAHPDLPSLVATMRTGLEALPDRVRTGQPRLAGNRPGEAAELYGELAAPLGTFFRDVAEEVADVVAAPGLSILDVGAGAAPWTRAIAAREPTAQVVAVDLPGVLPRTRAAVADDGLGEQFTFAECDVLAEPLPGDDHDLVLAANLCHLFDAATAARLVRRLAGAVRPDGTVAIVDAVPEHDDPQRRRSVALYAVGLLTRTATGGVHPLSDYASWLLAAGSDQVQRHDCERFPTSLITARIPA